MYSIQNSNLIGHARRSTFGSIQSSFNDGLCSTPDDPANRHRQMISEWEAEGNTIAPYVAPIVDPNDEIYSNRMLAYEAESDPLKIEAEYNALINNTDPDYSKWIEKVQEIKNRYPLEK